MKCDGMLWYESAFHFYVKTRGLVQSEEDFLNLFQEVINVLLPCFFYFLQNSYFSAIRPTGLIL